ncbi:MAG: valine--tRNA ligase [Candidatus Azobacteroides sp.]|nr:valine--tRNA ligase [Candidatus Azobacteroides sp.]
MEIATKYNPSEVEDKWYRYWMEKGFFHSEPDEREPYTIVIPPPNVTGVLHMGHMLNNTIQDILVRRARMTGKNACWVPGTDHASIATEAKVVAKLAKEEIKKTDLTREQFLEHAWDWTHKHGGLILEQLKKLGASCDWERTCFTMDKKRSESVLKVFVDLYNKGFIYRGVRMVNWDPAAQTALSDEEVIHREQKGKLYYLRYRIVGEDGYAVVATTRPETIFGDTAVCIHPDDPKNAHLKGKKVIVPLANREVPIIEDDYIDIEFGTGCLKVTPAHDINDYLLGEKHGLEIVDIFNDNGTLNRHGLQYEGMDRFEVRRQIERDLEKAGLMEKIEPYENKVGFSERTGVAIEPKLSMQWFLKMEDLAKPALEAVMNDTIQFYPAKFKNTYRHWMENIKDWCISRQLWWGHRIPAYFLPEGGGYVVAETPEKAVVLAREKSGHPDLQLSDLRQDEDSLDTWFSSWLWPISVFDGINEPHNGDIEYYYPTSDLITAPDIIFFWVARMIIAGYELRQKPCFHKVYFTGLVRDKLGRKMSKSLGNSPEPLDLIANYGADGVRMGLMLAAPAGNDLLFDESLCEQGRNFNNKIWNAFRLVKGWETTDKEQPESAQIAIRWFEAQLAKAIGNMDDSFGKYRISEALMEAYKLFWDEFSSWYLEIVKPDFEQPIDQKTYESTLQFFDALLRLLHPFMPFITEELWQNLEDRNEGESIMIAPLPVARYEYNSMEAEKWILDFETVKEIISNIRAIRLQKNIPAKEALKLQILGHCEPVYFPVISRMAKLSEIETTREKSPGAVSFLVKTEEFAVPLENNLQVEEELLRMQQELNYQRGFLDSVKKKLDNENFVSKAPAKIIEMEKKKQTDAESKIRLLEENIAALSK